MIEKIFLEELEALKEKNLYRSLKTLRPLSATEAEENGRKLLLFCGNDYLGLSRHPNVIKALQEAAQSYGTGAGAARLISGSADLHRQLEETLAAMKRKDKALIFSAGYLANLGVLSALAGEEDILLLDKLCHASLIDAARLSKAALRVFPHKNYDRCEEILKKSQAYRRRILVSDTVFSMDGDSADLKALIRLKKKYDALLIVDDAHGTGVFGKQGCGAVDGFEAEVDVITGTLSKSVGCLGGFAAASDALIKYLINFSRPFIFATALSPPLCAAALEAVRIFQTQDNLREDLWWNVRQVKKIFEDIGFSSGSSVSPILPILLGDEKKAMQVSADLYREGILIPAVRYPTVPKGAARLRVTVSSSHTAADLARLKTALQNIFSGIS